MNRKGPNFESFFMCFGKDEGCSTLNVCMLKLWKANDSIAAEHPG